MISSIVMTGEVGKLDGPIRYITCSQKDNPFTGEVKVSVIPTIYWTKSRNNLLTKLKTGTFVIVRGRLEMISNVGLAVVVETLQISMFK